MFEVPCSLITLAATRSHLAQAVADSRTVHLAVWAMGSVSDDLLGPWCGRVGNGGYAPDWVGYPICTDGALFVLVV